MPGEPNEEKQDERGTATTRRDETRRMGDGERREVRFWLVEIVSLADPKSCGAVVLAAQWLHRCLVELQLNNRPGRGERGSLPNATA